MLAGWEKRNHKKIKKSNQLVYLHKRHTYGLYRYERYRAHLHIFKFDAIPSICLMRSVHE